MINDFVSNGTATILSVDDNADKSELLSLILKDAGYHVISASDGGAALKIAQREIPSLIISDVSMPMMDGIEFCRLARADEKLRRVPIMLVTAFRKDTESLARGLKAGADDYLEAPFDPGRGVGCRFFVRVIQIHSGRFIRFSFSLNCGRRFGGLAAR